MKVTFPLFGVSDFVGKILTKKTRTQENIMVALLSCFLPPLYDCSVSVAITRAKRKHGGSEPATLSHLHGFQWLTQQAVRVVEGNESFPILTSVNTTLDTGTSHQLAPKFIYSYTKRFTIMISRMTD